jgi:hypothetical protein
VDTLSKLAIEVLKDDEKLQQFKKGASEQAKRFDISNIIPVYEKLYEEVLSKELVS